MVGGVWFGGGMDHLLAVKIEEDFGMLFKKAVAQNRLGRVGARLIVEAGGGAEVGNTALGRDTGAAEEDHIPAAVYCFPQRLYRCVFFHFSVLSGRVCPWFVASFCAFFRTEPIGASKKKRLRLIF